MIRKDKRRNDQLREFSFQPGFQLHPAGSVLACFGRTRVICAASVEMGVPRWMKEQNLPGGWVTAEYQMLPAATHQRHEREVTRGKISGRSAEIQRLIGRALRAAVPLESLPGLTVHIDCDVLDADGGTRCASITGACLALELALRKLAGEGTIPALPPVKRVAAVSVGLFAGTPLLDLDYAEDAAAAVDMNVVMTADGRLVEIQGTGEEATFTESELGAMLQLAKGGLQQIFAAMDQVLS